MSLRVKILVIVLFFLFTAISALYVFVNMHGTTILKGKLSRALGREVKVGGVRTVPLFNIRVKNIEIPGLGKINRVYARGGAIDILRKDFILSELRLDGLEITVERLKGKTKLSISESETPPAAVPVSIKTPSPSSEGKIRLPGRLIVKCLKINDATIHLIDRTLGEKGVTVTVNDLSVTVENLMFPITTSIITSFEIEGRVPWQKEVAPKEGEIYASGWINFFKRDMQARLDIKDIDAISLYPYYDRWVDLEGARIQQAKLLFGSDIAGHNGEVIAQCHLELTDIVFRPREEKEPEDKAHKIATAVIDLLQHFSERVAVDFTIKTKMEKPDFNFDSIRTAVEDKINKASAASKSEELPLQTALTFPVKLLEGGVKSATDLSRALIDGAFAVGKEVKEGVEDIMQDKKGQEEKKKEEQKGSEQPAQTPATAQ